MTRVNAMAPPLPPAGNASAAMNGMMWVAASNVLVRVITFAGQIVIGWLLVPEDFGIWALAVSISTAIQALRNGGTAQILIKRGHDYPAQVGLIYRFSLAFNVFAMALLGLIAAVTASSRPTLAVVLVGIALSIPLGTPAMILKARLTIDARFRELASIGFGSAVVWQVSIAALAFCGFGAMSFALPPLLQAAYESFASWRHTQSMPSTQTNANKQDYWLLFRESRWVMLSAAALGLATTGGYFAVAMLTDNRTAGIYFFGFQLVVAASAPLYGALEVVLPPLLTRLNETPERQLRAASRAIRTVLVAGTPFAAAFALAAPLAMNLVWHGAWDMAAPVAQILAACVPAWLLVSVGRSLIEARGLWRARFFVLGVYGIGGMVAASIGILVGGVEAIATAVASFYVAYAIVFLLMLKRLGLSAYDTVVSFFAPLALTIVAMLAGWAAGSALPGGVSGALHDLVTIAGFLLVALVGNLLFFRTVWQEIVGLVLRRMRRRPA